MRFQISGLKHTHTRPSKHDRSTARRVWQRKGWEHETIGKRSEYVAMFRWDTKHVVVLWIPPLFYSILPMPNSSPPRCSSAVYPSDYRIIAYLGLAVEEDLCFVRYVDVWTPSDGYVEPRLWPCSRLQFLDLAQSPSVNPLPCQMATSIRIYPYRTHSHGNQRKVDSLTVEPARTGWTASFFYPYLDAFAPTRHSVTDYWLVVYLRPCFKPSCLSPGGLILLVLPFYELSRLSMSSSNLL